MQPNLASSTTSVLFIDGNDAGRAYFAEGLKSRSSDYLILEASDGESGLDPYGGLRGSIVWCWNSTCQIDQESRY